MSERTIEKRQDWTSDIVWVVLYSILVLLLMAMLINLGSSRYGTRNALRN
jgi:hypothetical protein